MVKHLLINTVSWGEMHMSVENSNAQEIENLMFNRFLFVSPFCRKPIKYSPITYMLIHLLILYKR